MVWRSLCACPGLDCGVFMLSNILAIVTGHQSCNEIDPTRVREWFLEELYLDGVRSKTSDFHYMALLLDDARMQRCLFGSRQFGSAPGM